MYIHNCFVCISHHTSVWLKCWKNYAYFDFLEKKIPSLNNAHEIWKCFAEMVKHSNQSYHFGVTLLTCKYDTFSHTGPCYVDILRFSSPHMLAVWCYIIHFVVMHAICDTWGSIVFFNDLFVLKNSKQMNLETKSNEKIVAEHGYGVV